MTFSQQVLSSVVTLLLIPLALKGFDILFRAAAARFGTPRRKSYLELEQEIWRLRDTLRRVNATAIQLDEWHRADDKGAVKAGIANLRAEIDPTLLPSTPIPVPNSQ